MSVQIFLQGALAGLEDFLCAPGDPGAHARRADSWSSELPARFLAEQGLSPILLGSSGGGQFLLVLPDNLRDEANRYLSEARAEIARESGGRVRLIWAATENLGTWKLIVDRLETGLARVRGAAEPDAVFEPFDPQPADGEAVRPVPPRAVLRGDVDNFAHLIRAAESVESHVSLSVLYRQFFAGELPRLCAGQPVEMLYAGGDDFAAAGDWEALIALGVELNRLFERFVQENLKHMPGPEGKTLSMALALPYGLPDLASVFRASGEMLNGAKAVTRGGFHLFGRTIEWKQFPEAQSIKDQSVRLVKEFKCSTQFLDELKGFYPESRGTGRRGVAKFDRPWRFWRRLAVTLDPDERRSRSREFAKLRDALAAEVIGKNVGQARLRPTGRVGLEWAHFVVSKPGLAKLVSKPGLAKAAADENRAAQRRRPKRGAAGDDRAAALETASEMLVEAGDALEPVSQPVEPDENTVAMTDETPGETEVSSAESQSPIGESDDPAEASSPQEASRQQATPEDESTKPKPENESAAEIA